MASHDENRRILLEIRPLANAAQRVPLLRCELYDLGTARRSRQLHRHRSQSLPGAKGFDDRDSAARRFDSPIALRSTHRSDWSEEDRVPRSCAYVATVARWLV